MGIKSTLERRKKKVMMLINKIPKSTGEIAARAAMNYWNTEDTLNSLMREGIITLESNKWKIKEEKEETK